MSNEAADICLELTGLSGFAVSSTVKADWLMRKVILETAICTDFLRTMPIDIVANMMVPPDLLNDKQAL